MGTIRIVPGGLTDHPAEAPLGSASEAHNIDFSDLSARTRRGVLPYNGNLSEGPGGIDSFPTLLAHFRDTTGAVHELRGWTPSSGSSGVQAYHGMGGPVSGAVLGAMTIDSGMRTSARWSWTEFNGRAVVATDPQPNQDGATLLVFDPIEGWSRPQAIDRTVTPYHGSAFFYGLDGDDEGPYLETPPSGTLVASHSGRLFVAGLPDVIDGVRYGNLLDVDGWPGNNIIRITDGDTQGITAMRPLGRLLVIYKSRSIHVGTVLSQYDAQVRTAVDGIGCMAHATVQDVQGRHIFLGEDGVYAFDGTSTDYLSQPIERSLRALKPRFHLARAVHYRKRHQYWLWFPSGSVLDGIMGDVVYVYDLRRETWARYEFAQGNMALGPLSSHLHSSGEEYLMGAVRFESAVTGQELIYFARFDTGDRDYDISSDAIGSRLPIVSRWVSAPITWKDQSSKRWLVLRPLMGSRFSSYWTVWFQEDAETRGVAQDNDQEFPMDGWGDWQEQTRSLFGRAVWGADDWTEWDVYADRCPLRGWSRTLTVGAEETSMQGWIDIHAIDVDVDPTGRW